MFLSSSKEILRIAVWKSGELWLLPATFKSKETLKTWIMQPLLPKEHSRTQIVQFADSSYEAVVFQELSLTPWKKDSLFWNMWSLWVPGNYLKIIVFVSLFLLLFCEWELSGLQMLSFVLLSSSNHCLSRECIFSEILWRCLRDKEVNWSEPFKAFFSS